MLGNWKIDWSYNKRGKNVFMKLKESLKYSGYERVTKYHIVTVEMMVSFEVWGGKKKLERGKNTIWPKIEFL